MTIIEYNILKESTLHVVLRLSGKKPIILFYPSVHNEIKEQTITKLQLNCDHVIRTNMYPEPKITYKHASLNKIKYEWSIDVHNNGTIIDHTNRQYSYIFWEMETTELIKLNNKFNFIESIVHSIQNIDFMAPIIINSKDIYLLDIFLENYGLNVKERNDLITFWLPQLQSKKYVKLQIMGSLKSNNINVFFNSSYYDEVAELEFKNEKNEQSKFNYVLRIFLLFQSLNETESISTYIEQHESLRRTILENKNYVVEWGGMEIY